jgi:hypothetical protein
MPPVPTAKQVAAFGQLTPSRWLLTLPVLCVVQVVPPFVVVANAPFAPVARQASDVGQLIATSKMFGTLVACHVPPPLLVARAVEKPEPGATAKQVLGDGQVIPATRSGTPAVRASHVAPPSLVVMT